MAYYGIALSQDFGDNPIPSSGRKLHIPCYLIATRQYVKAAYRRTEQDRAGQNLWVLQMWSKLYMSNSNMFYVYVCSDSLKDKMPNLKHKAKKGQHVFP